MNLIKSLNWRYAVKQFNNKSVSHDQLAQLIEVVRLTPSSYGLQPYKLVVVETDKIREQLVEHSYGQDKVANSSHLLVLATYQNIDQALIDRYFTLLAKTHGRDPESLQGFKNHVQDAILSKSDSERAIWAAKQAYIALGNLTTALATMEIDGCPMEGFDAGAFNQVLNLTEQGLNATVICPIGYRAETDTAAQATKVRPSNEDFLVRI